MNMNGVKFGWALTGLAFLSIINKCELEKYSGAI